MDIPDELARSAKAASAHLGITLKQFVIEAVQSRLASSTDSGSYQARVLPRIGTTKKADSRKKLATVETVPSVESGTELIDRKRTEHCEHGNDRQCMYCKPASECSDRELLKRLEKGFL